MLFGGRATCSRGWTDRCNCSRVGQRGPKIAGVIQVSTYSYHSALCLSFPLHHLTTQLSNTGAHLHLSDFFSLADRPRGLLASPFWLFFSELHMRTRAEFFRSCRSVWHLTYSRTLSWPRSLPWMDQWHFRLSPAFRWLCSSHAMRFWFHILGQWGLRQRIQPGGARHSCRHMDSPNGGGKTETRFGLPNESSDSWSGQEG
jgi:hypothetical protein